MNKDFKNIFKKVGREVKNQSRQVGTKVKSFNPKLKMIGLLVFAVAAVWVVMPARGAEAAFSYDDGNKINYQYEY